MSQNVRQALAPDDAAPAHRKVDFSLLRRLWHYIRPYRRMAYLTLFLSLASGLLRIAQPLLARRIIDVEIAHRDMAGVVRMSAFFLLIILVGAISDILFNYLSQWVGQRAMHDLRRKLFRHILDQDVVFFDRNPVGRLITRMTSDIQTLNDLFATGVVATIGQLMVLFGVLAVMLYFDVRLTLVFLACVPLMAPVLAYFRRTSRKWYLEARRTLATLNAYLQENIAGMRTVQSYNRERHNQAIFADLNSEYRQCNLNTIFAFAIFFPAMSIISSLAGAGVIWVGGHEIIQGRTAGVAADLSFGELFLFLQCMQMLFHPIRALSEKYNLLQSAMASSVRIFSLLDRRPAVQPPDHPHPIPETLADAIRFEDVHFAYQLDEPVIKGVSFDLPRGATVAVVGATGAGKSTLINLMTRFYDVAAGRITFDGIDLRRFDPHELRRRFAVVLQDVFIFSGTVADNIRLANPDLSDEQLWEILRQVNAADFVADLPGGLHAPVTERGGTFSTGQKQLFAFARALAADPSILVLDEATANIDTQTEQMIQQAIGRVLAGRTSLVIAHRLSTIQRADQILVMHHGHIHERGTHDQLLARDGLYRRLHQMQYRREAVSS